MYVYVCMHFCQRKTARQRLWTFTFEHYRKHPVKIRISHVNYDQDRAQKFQ